MIRYIVCTILNYNGKYIGKYMIVYLTDTMFLYIHQHTKRHAQNVLVYFLLCIYLTYKQFQVIQLIIQLICGTLKGKKLVSDFLSI